MFGIATEAQLDTTRRWSQHVRSDNQRVIHNTNELVTVVNRTFAEVRLNGHFEIARTHAISTIAFERVRVSLRMDQCLSAVESLYFLVSSAGPISQTACRVGKRIADGRFYRQPT